jgi:cytohesin
MKIRTKLLAGLMGSALFAGAAFAADTGVSLVTAAKQGDRAAVQSLVNGSAKQDVAGVQGTGALVWAATRNDAQMVDVLLRAGANVKAANEFGATALYAAAEHADPAMTKKLLAAGGDPNVALMSGETPLMVAASRGNVETVRALLSGGANPNAKTAVGEATTSNNGGGGGSKYGAQEANGGGHTALMYALSQRQAAVVDELVKRGADVNLGSQSGFTPLMFAAQQNDVDSASLLLKAGAKPNEAQPKTGMTPLMIASSMSNAQAVDVLLDNKADANAVDANGYTALHKAVRDSDYGVNVAAKDRILSIVKSLLKHGANPNARLVVPAAVAAEELKNTGVANYRKRAALTLTEIDLQGATPLLLAAEVNNYDVIKTLVDAGADPRIPTDKGTTALMMAAGAGTDVQRERPDEERALAVDTAKLLIEHGVDVNAAGQYGWTALHSAAYQGIKDLISYLVSKGADVNSMDSFGQTPLSISMSVLTQDIGARRLQIPRRFRGDVAQLLLDLGATPLDKSGVVVVLQRSGDLDFGRAGGEADAGAGAQQ